MEIVKHIIQIILEIPRGAHFVFAHMGADFIVPQKATVALTEKYSRAGSRFNVYRLF